MKSTLVEYLRHFRFKSVFFSYVKNTTLLVLVVFFPAAIILFAYYDYNYYENLRQFSISASQKSNELFNTLLYPFDMNFQVMRTNSNTQKFLRSAPNTSTLEYRDLQRSLASIVEENDFIQSAEIFSFRNSLVISPESVIDADYIFSNMPQHWYTVYKASKSSFLIFPRKEDSESFNTLYIAKEIVTENFVRGVFCLKIDYSYFRDIITRTFSEDPEQLYVISDIGLILYSNDERYINKALFCADGALWDEYNDVLRKEDQLSIDRTHVRYISTSRDKAMNVFSKMLESDMHLKSPFTPMFFICFAALILLISLILSLFLSVKMYRSIVDLVELIRFPRKNNKSFSNLGEYLAIGDQLANNYLANQEINSELQENLVKLKAAQRIALQSQINPHFIFNTLQIVNLLILNEVKHDNDAIRIVGMLADLMNATFESSDYFIPIREEIAYTIRYLDIMKIRYKNRLHVFLDIDEEIQEFQTVKLLCQPIIENAFKHAFVPQNPRWEIHLRCRCDETSIVYEIRDNGIGMDEEARIRLNEMLAAADIEFTEHIGLANTLSRLKLLFDNAYALRVESGANGTTVYIQHPIIE